MTTTADAPGPDVESLGYEQARDELVDIVRRLESGNLPLEESLRLWERGEQLHALCLARLDQAEQRVAELLERMGRPVQDPPAGG